MLSTIIGLSVEMIAYRPLRNAPRFAVIISVSECQFDKNGDMVRDMLMYVVKDGAAVFYKAD
jgi:hypothetical protein